ncbi:hypothetical protein AB6A40_001409 [Gnathostoma spinigerum]|uniref:PRELI/MSF1 domain-containing protein n=1 Tax=Gnathostoma spinigerum TaxID=75299 RepID=A0ABD6EEF2_9BILA
MRFWESPSHLFNYSFDDVVTVFWNRYPNSKAQHILSEDVLERKIMGDEIITRKLILKKGATFLKAAPKWMKNLTNVQVVPTIEESIYDRKKKTLVTYTRNISWTSVFHMDERCVYKPAEALRLQQDQQLTFVPRTQLERAVCVTVNYFGLSSIIERFMIMSFKKSVKKTVLGISEKLEEKFGPPLTSSSANAATKMSEKASSIKEKIMANKNINFGNA